MEEQDAQDVLRRLDKLKIGRDGVDESVIMAAKILPAAKDVLCSVCESVNPRNASSTLALKSLRAAPPGSKQIEEALRQYDKAVCGPSAASKHDVRPWQSSLERLIGHLQADRILQKTANRLTQAPPKAEGFWEANARQNTDILREIADLVGVELPQNATESAASNLAAIQESVKKLKENMPEPVSRPILSKADFSAEKVEMLQNVHAAFEQEYTVRRKMMIERAKVTLQAMLLNKAWLDQQGTFEDAKKAAEQGQNALRLDPNVSFDQVFTATITDIASVTSQPINQDKDKFRATVKDVIIGAVPDRGGRPPTGSEGAREAAMPAWAPRSSTGGQKRGRSGAGGHGGRGTQGRRGRGKH